MIARDPATRPRWGLRARPRTVFLQADVAWSFALAADAQAGDLRGPLWTLYADIFTCYALKNPMYAPGSPIQNSGFASAVEGFVKGLPGFGQKF